MKNNKYLILRRFNNAQALIAICLTAAGENNGGATSVVDTGANSNSGRGWLLNGGQWLAGEFQVDQTTLVSGVEGFFGVGARGGTITAAIYANDSANGSLPGTLLHSATFEIAPSGRFLARWAGASELNWNIAPGSYWLAFQVGGGSLFSGQMPGNAHSALGKEAFFDGSEWYRYDALDMGVRITGSYLDQETTNEVPDAGSSFFLLSLGFLSLAALKFKSGHSKDHV